MVQQLEEKLPLISFRDTQPQCADSDEESPQTPRDKATPAAPSSPGRTAVAVVGAIVTLGLVATAALQSAGEKPVKNDSGRMETVQGLKFVASTAEYGSSAGAKYPWIGEGKCVEPHRLTTLSASFPADSSDVSFTWSFDGRESVEGASLTHVFDTVGEYAVTLEARDINTGLVLESITEDVVCRYVRREIRSLTDEDREAYFNAAAVVYQTSLADGRAQYGPDFMDVQWFAQLHNSLAGSKDCDHMHDGLGFLGQHAAFTLMFEKVLQLVDAKVSVPFWDYTIEAHSVTEAGSIDAWRQSVVWSDDWFGEASPEGFVIKRGRFAQTPVVGKAWNLTDTVNAYGFVRAPWNMNKIPHVTRHNFTYGLTLDDAPGCKQHYDVMQEDVWSKFGSDIQYAPHGTVHAMIGGVWGADFKTKLLNHGYSAVHTNAVGLEAFATQKNLWRANLLNCPDYCAEDAPASECKCTCTNLDTWLQNGFTADILSSVSPLFYTKSYLLNTNKQDISDIILKLFCNAFDEYSPVIGDALESSSPMDISFWPTHPTVDRLYHWRRINGFSDAGWIDDMSRSVSYQATGYCWGHNQNDVTVWKNLFDKDESPYSNLDLWEAFDPTQVSKMPYVYDNFEWSHCADEGYPIDLMG